MTQTRINPTVLRFILLSLSLIYLCVSKAYTQTAALKYNQFTHSDGLSNDFVNTIVEDSRGFIWIGTRSGLNHFDGNTNHFFVNNSENSASLSTNDISHLISLSNNILLAGTWGKGINRVDAASKRIKRLGIGSIGEELFVKRMLSKNDSIVWVGTFGNGLLEYNLNTDRFQSILTDFEEVEGINDFKFCQDICYHQGRLWICNNMGQIAYLEEGSSKIKLLKNSENQLINFGETLCITPHEDQIAFSNTNGEIILYHPNTQESTTKTLFSKKNSNNKINSFIKSGNKVWAATSFELKYYDLSKDTVVEVVSSNEGEHFKNIFCLYSDSRDILWLGTWGQGLKGISQKPNLITEIRLNDQNVTVNGIMQSNNKNEILLATTRGVYTYNTLTARRAPLNFQGDLGQVISEENIIGVFKYGSEMLICTFQSGLFIADQNLTIRPFQFNPDTQSFKQQSITSISKLPNGEIWIGSWTHGVLVLNEHNKKQQRHHKACPNKGTLSSNGVFGATLGSDGQVYIGTYKGLSSYNYTTGEFTDYEIKTSKNLSEGRIINTVRSVVEDKFGRFWLASIDGLVVFDSRTQETPSFFDLRGGLADNVVYTLRIAGGYVWATTKKGLSRISIEDLTITNFTENSGLPSNMFNDNAALLDSDLLYLGLGEQVVFFNPKTLKKEQHKIEFSITDFYVNDQIVQSEDGIIEGSIFGKESIVLDADNNNVSFEISIKDYLTQSKTRHFVHRISGIDENWIPYNYGQRLIRYPNLPSGRHTFQFTEVLESGQLRDNVLELEIQIKYPIWKKWWFLLAVIILIGLLFYLLVRYRTITISRKNKELETKVASRTAEIEKSNQELKIQRRAIRDNVKYASRLQISLLPKREEIDLGFKENFIFFKPRDIVSGDFFWYQKIGPKKILVVADCTGHGVSGAFVSVIGITYLKTIVGTMKVTNPSFILNMLHNEINKSFNEENGKIRDGMDISILCYDEDKKVLDIASAMNSVLLVNEDKSFRRIRGDKFPVGGEDGSYKEIGKYTLHSLPIHQKQKIYLYSDGFQDQFGGGAGSKFMSTRFRQLLVDNSDLPMKDQYQIIQDTFYDWKEGHHQVDDVLVMGICLDPHS